MTAPWRALVRRHGIGTVQVVLPMLGWFLVPAMQRVLLPWAGVVDLSSEEYVFSAMVVALLIPVSLLAAQLQEPFAELAVATPRPPSQERAWVLVGCLTQAATGLAAASLLLPSSGVRLLVLGDGLLALGTAVVGHVLLGTGRGWTLPACLLAASSVPGIATWPQLSLYRQDDAPLITMIGAAVLGLGVGAYLWRGTRHR